MLSTAGNLYAYDGSGNYATSLVGTPIASLGSGVYVDPTLLTNAQPPVNYSQLYSLQQQYQFTGVGFYNVGALAYVLSSATANSFGNNYYLLSPAGGIYPYNPGGNYSLSLAGTPVATGLDPGVYANPALLLNAGRQRQRRRPVRQVVAAGGAAVRPAGPVPAASTPGSARQRGQAAVQQIRIPASRTARITTRWCCQPPRTRRCCTPGTAAATRFRQVPRQWRPSIRASTTTRCCS